MDPHLYKDIQECNAPKCWCLVKDVIANQLFDEYGFPVPYLIDAPHYDHGAVLVKESLTPVEKIKRKRAGIIAVGHIQDFITDEKQSGFLSNYPNTKTVNTTINPSYIFNEADTKNKIRKALKVEIYGCEEEVLAKLPKEDSFIVDMAGKGFQYLDKIYMIYEVFYADKVVVTVEIGNETDRLEISERIPIGFKMRKYNLKENGSLGENKDVPHKDSYQWIKRSHFRNPMDTLPTPA